MGRIVVSENVSLDGVMQDPTGEEGFQHGGWFTDIGDGDRAAWAGATLQEARAASALLLGRHSYEYFASRWPSRTGDLADRMNGVPKYVVSSTLAHPDWANTSVVRGVVPDAVARLRDELDGDIVVYASGRLVGALLEHDLVDALSLTIFPVVLGSGERLFGELDDKTALRLVQAGAIGDGLVHVAYERVHAGASRRGQPQTTLGRSVSRV